MSMSLKYEPSSERLQAILVADSSDECEGADPTDGCGTVCEVAACSPGHCLSYDFSTDSDFCERCYLNPTP